MDLQKPKNSRPDTHNDQDDSPEYRMDGFGRPADSKNIPENESLDPRQDAPSNGVSTAEMSVARITSGLSRAMSRPRPSSRNVQKRKSRSPDRTFPIPRGLRLTRNELLLLQSADSVPPVTKETLSELDLVRIMGNIHLRTDANFVRDLHFIPELDGEKGRKKRRAAREYWEALRVEITIYAYCSLNNIPMHVDQNSDLTDEVLFRPRLPRMFETLQDVLKTLVPERDHPGVMQNLDVPLLMQQVHNGVFNLVGLATWLAELLKMHCAPMRDQIADEMVEKISIGYAVQNMANVVNGLETLFGILEMMKLDVANHQIRTFRMLLIEDTIQFLQNYFADLIGKHGFEIDGAAEWYIDLQNNIPRQTKESGSDAFRPVAVMFHGLFELLLQYDDRVEFQPTFQYDVSRLLQLRTEIQNLVNIDICWSVMQESVPSSTRWSPSERGLYHSWFRSRISSLLEDDDNQHPRSTDTRAQSMADLALEIVRFASVECRSGDASDDAIYRAERLLGCYVAHESCRMQHIQTTIRTELQTATFRYARKYLTMSPLAICESQRGRQYHREASISQRYGMELETVAMRLAHIGVLHWRVWGPLVYLTGV